MAIAETVLYLCFSRGMGKREKEEAYVKEAHVRQVLTIPLANQNNSPGQPKWSLRAAIAIRYNCHVQLVANRRGRMRVANLKL